MKSIIAIFTAIVTIATCADQDFLDKAKARMVEATEECVKEVGATEDDLKELMEVRFPSKKEAKCLLACYHKKYGIQDKDGKLDKAASIEAMKDLKTADPETYDKAVQLFDICMDQVPNQDCQCQTAAIFMYCFNVYGKTMGLQPGMVPM